MSSDGGELVGDVNRFTTQTQGCQVSNLLPTLGVSVATHLGNGRKMNMRTLHQNWYHCVQQHQYIASEEIFPRVARPAAVIVQLDLAWLNGGHCGTDRGPFFLEPLCSCTWPDPPRTWLIFVLGEVARGGREGKLKTEEQIKVGRWVSGWEEEKEEEKEAQGLIGHYRTPMWNPIAECYWSQ